ncbi:hypothetical protein BGZ90_003887 [Linnemannia elongata]|nr:hypothetical protein BGZ90_003887 [Linnemannia elongata]
MAGNSGRVTKKAPAKKAGTKSTSSGSKALYSGTAQGTTQLPVARVKRIIKEDKDVQMVSNDAVFLISLATELFLESFTAKAFNLAKIEKRKTVSYKDLGNVVLSSLSRESMESEDHRGKSPRQCDPQDDDIDGSDQEEANGSQAGSDDEEEEGEESSRPMSEDEGELSTPEDMDED